MIRIIQGVYGCRSAAPSGAAGGRIQPKTAKDAPFTLDAERERRLVERGVAVYITPPEAEPAQPVIPSLQVKPEVPAKQTVQTKPVKQSAQVVKTAPAVPAVPEDGGLPAYDAGMKLAELKTIAKLYGVDASGIPSKAGVVAAIDAARAEDETVDDDEAPPVLGAAEPV